METKQLVKAVIVYAICFALCVVAMCLAQRGKKDDKNEFEELNGVSQNSEQISTFFETDEEVYLEVNGNEV